MVPFICELAADFALCEEAPKEVGEAVLVAEAYDLTGSCAETAPDGGAVEALEEGEGALLVLLAKLGELSVGAVVMSGLGGL
jgi:hypothetical protein